MQGSWKVAVAALAGAFGFQAVAAAGELGGACVFKPRPVSAKPAMVKSWEAKDEEPAAHGAEHPVSVKLVSDHAPAPSHGSSGHNAEPAHAAAPMLQPPQGVPPLLRNVLTNEGVAMMAQAGYTERFIIDMIKRKPTKFDVTPSGLAWLAQMGLTERIVRAMVANERKEEDTAMVPGYLSLAPESAAPAPAAKGGKGKQKSTERTAVPVTIQTPGEYWYSRTQGVLAER